MCTVDDVVIISILQRRSDLFGYRKARRSVINIGFSIETYSGGTATTAITRVKASTETGELLEELHAHGTAFQDVNSVLVVSAYADADGGEEQEYVYPWAKRKTAPFLSHDAITLIIAAVIGILTLALIGVCVTMWFSRSHASYGILSDSADDAQSPRTPEFRSLENPDFQGLESGLQEAYDATGNYNSQSYKEVEMDVMGDMDEGNYVIEDEDSML